jgi:hypothetical protein
MQEIIRETERYLGTLSNHLIGVRNAVVRFLAQADQLAEAIKRGCITNEYKRLRELQDEMAQTIKANTV